MDQLSKEAEETQSVNTVYMKNNKIIGHNTDIEGFELNIKDTKFNATGKKIFIIGAGGVVPSLIFALKKMKASNIIISNRTKQNAELLCSDLGVEAKILTENTVSEFIGSSQLVVNTTSLGQQEGEENNLIDFESLNSSAHVYDLIYNPSKTTFLRHAEKNGCTVQNGLEMLIHQAAQSFKLWHGTMPEIDEDLMSVLGVN